MGESIQMRYSVTLVSMLLFSWLGTPTHSSHCHLEFSSKNKSIPSCSCSSSGCEDEPQSGTRVHHSYGFPYGLPHAPYTAPCTTPRTTPRTTPKCIKTIAPRILAECHTLLKQRNELLNQLSGFKQAAISQRLATPGDMKAVSL